MTCSHVPSIPRSAGLLVHPTCFPGRFGIGDLGPEAERFIQWAAAGGQSVWQVLPLGPTGFGNPPYTALSAFAGNPLLISPEILSDEGLLPAQAIESAPTFSDDRVEFDQVVPWRMSILRASWDHFQSRSPAQPRRDYEAFITNPAQSHWLDDWALYIAIKGRCEGKAWQDWPREVRLREPGALAAARRDLAAEAAFARYVQFLFFRQWDRIRAFANARGIRVMGDIPIYVALDSADVWANSRLFALDGEGRPVAVAGVPPDLFSRTGQRWGNPLFLWDRVEAEGVAWWIDRMRVNFRLADLVRIDHFRGFAAYWEVPASESTAAHGRWVKGPGKKLFDAVRSALNDHPIVAEDLGVITEDVRELRSSLGFPGMRVLQFGFVDFDSDHLPHHHVPRCAVYTGTHDNDTTRGWFEKTGEEERRRILDYVGGDGSEIHWDMIRTAYTSVASLAIVPVQDVFGLGSEARMNTPGKSDGNWRWRARREMFTDDLAERLKRLASTTGRLGSGRP